MKVNFPFFFLQIFTTSSNIRNRSNTSETSDIGDTSDTSDTRGTRDTSDTSDTSGTSDTSDTSERGNHFPADKIGFVAIFSTNLGYIWSIKVILVFSLAYWLSSGPQ